jgi:hypothetical protein
VGISFETATKRRWVQSCVLTTALHIAVVIGLSVVLTNHGGGELWLTAALGYGVFLSISLIWWTSRQLVAWFVYRIIWRSTAVRELVTAFENAKFPRPDAYMNSPRDYFQEIINDESADVPMRIGAASHYLRLTEFASGNGFWAAYRTTGLYEESLTAYRANFRRE